MWGLSFRLQLLHVGKLKREREREILSQHKGQNAQADARNVSPRWPENRGLCLISPQSPSWLQGGPAPCGDTAVGLSGTAPACFCLALLWVTCHKTIAPNSLECSSFAGARETLGKTLSHQTVVPPSSSVCPFLWDFLSFHKLFDLCPGK